jgi:ATP-binding cassette, subfamily B, bacterial
MNKKPHVGSAFKIISLAKPYFGFIFIIFLVSLASNGLNLAVPKIIAADIDTFRTQSFNFQHTFLVLSLITLAIFVLSLIESLMQTYLSEKIGRDLRTRLITKISNQPFSFINEITPEKLLTNLTGDIDNLKQVIALGLVQVFSSIILIFGASALLISVNRPLAFIVLTIIPLIIIVFAFIFSKIRHFFKRAQAIIDRLNKTINESIVASSLIRILNSQSAETQKFLSVNSDSRDIGLSILKLFSSLLPLISIIANLSLVVILFVGGRYIVAGTFTIGGLTAFISYVSMLIFPIIIMGFISNVMARAAASFERISAVLYAPSKRHKGKLAKEIAGKVTFKNVSLNFGNKQILKSISFEIPAGSRTAILGPTAAGKTQIFYLLAGLLKSTSGRILIDDIAQSKYSSKSLADQIGLVFQDSSIFNTSIRENINFKNVENEDSFQKAINTAELQDFIQSLPDGLETKVSERGASLSGGQKQRITLARALVTNPKILLLDDFTARVDRETEKRIFQNLKKNYQGITQILITQQIASIKDFDQIILVMEGELLAIGTHSELLETSPEYQQIYNSQKSTEQ